jgi:mRNA interferase MazF
MKRGDLVTVALQGEHGKPRPALIIQADEFAATDYVAALLLTSTLRDAPLIRVLVSPNTTNNLRHISQIELDRCIAIKRSRIGSVFGRVDGATLQVVNRLLAVFLGIA